MARSRTKSAPPPPPDDRPWFATDSPASRRLACEIAFGDWTGTTLIAGEPDGAVSAGLAAQSSGITFASAPKRVRGARAALERNAPLWTAIAATDGDGAPVVDEPHRNLVVRELPDDDPADRLERLMGSTADGGGILLDVPRPTPQIERRLLRVVAAGAEHGRAERCSWAAPDRLIVFARRRAPYGDDLVDEPAGAAPATLIVLVDGSVDARLCEEVLADLLVRSALPPHAAFILDLSKDPKSAVPADLFGIRPSPLTSVALLPKPGASAAEALNDALGGVETPYVAFIDGAAARFASQHVAAAAMALEARPEAAAAFPDVAETAVDGAFLGVRRSFAASKALAWRAVAERAAFPLAAGVWRTKFVRGVSGGFDVAGGAAAGFDFMLRAAERASFAAVPFLTAALRPDRADAASETARAEATVRAVLRMPTSALATAFFSTPESDRAATATALAGDLLLGAGRAREAAVRFEAALAKGPVSRRLLGGASRAFRAAGSRERAAALAAEAPDPVTATLLRGLAAADAGDGPAARALFESVPAGDPARAIALCNVVATRLASGEDAIVEFMRALEATGGFADSPESMYLLGSGGPKPGRPPPLSADERVS